jgi:hypothetical protein
MRVGRHITHILIPAICLLPACAGTSESPDPLVGAYVVIDPAGTIHVDVGSADSVAADVIGLESGVTFTSSQPAVAAINATTGVIHAVAPGTATITATAVANPTLKSTMDVAVVPPGSHAKEMSTLINEVCPNEDERYLNDSVPIDAELLVIHEFHDCQRLIRANHYESLVGIFAHQNVATLKRPNQFREGRLAAIIVNFQTKRVWRNYEPLGLAPGTNCLMLKFTPAGDGEDQGRWDAAIVTPPTRGRPYRNCPDRMDWSDVPEAQKRLLQVIPQRRAEAPDGRHEAPPVARWDWDAERGVNYLGVRCGERGWCEIGANGFTPLPAVKTASGANMFKGYYDEQYLADENGRLSDVWGTVTPGKDAIRHDRIKRDGRWYETAKIDLSARNTGSAALAFYTNRLNMPIVTIPGTQRQGGKANLTISSPRGAFGQDWDLLVNGQPLQVANPKMKFRGHPNDGHNRAATVRWRWNEEDESVWSYCAEAGCCEMAKLK